MITEIRLKIRRSMLENLQRRQENDASASRHFRHRQKVIRHEIAEFKSSWKGLHVGPVQEGRLTAHPVKTSSNPDGSASSGRIQGLPGFCHGAGNIHSWFVLKSKTNITSILLDIWSTVGVWVEYTHFLVFKTRQHQVLDKMNERNKKMQLTEGQG